MILKRIHIKNFRSIQDVTLDVTSQLAIVGGNGAGKSSVLRAVERFFGQSTTVDLDDFFGRRVDSPIEIGLTFTDFTEQESENFASRIHGNEMAVVRVFEATGGRNNGRYYGATMQHPPFQAIREAGGAQPMRTAYSGLRESDEAYATLPAVTRADQIPQALAEWEAANAGQCSLLRDDGQFFGFTNVARGALNRSTSFVFIPAVRDVSLDALDARGAVIARLMELVVRSAIQRRKDVREFQSRISTEYKILTDPQKLIELGGLSDELTDTLKLFYEDAAVLLKWQPPADFAIPLPAADVLLDDDGFEGPVDKKGHGLQRAFIFTLLQHLARAMSASTDAESSEAAEPEEEVVSSEQKVNVSQAEQADTGVALPGLILAIEEPELYQHPTKQRHFAKVLSSLSKGDLPGVATRTQIMFATHSSLFVSMERFNEIAIARRVRVAECTHKACKLTSSTLDQVAMKLERAHQKEPGTFSGEGLRARLHVIDSEIAEGFFADTVVLVEGVSDRAAILAAAELDGLNFGGLGIAVVAADGKTKLDRSVAVFSSFEIPTFVIWDCDKKGDQIQQVEHNRALQRLMEVSEDEVIDAATKVSGNFACFETDLNKVLRSEIGEDVYQSQVELIRAEFGIEESRDMEKSPFAMTALLMGAAKLNGRSKTLSEIVAAIVKLRETRAASVDSDDGNDTELAETEMEEPNA